MSDPTAVERMRRYRERQRAEAAKHVGKIRLRAVYVTPGAHAMLSMLGEIYGDVSAAIEEAVRQLHGKHYQRVFETFHAELKIAPPKPPRPQSFDPGKAARREVLVRRVKELRDAGMNASTIADQLNREGEPTLSGTGTWRHKSVLALLNEAGER